MRRPWLALRLCSLLLAAACVANDGGQQARYEADRDGCRAEARATEGEDRDAVVARCMAARGWDVETGGSAGNEAGGSAGNEAGGLERPGSGITRVPDPDEI